MTLCSNLIVSLFEKIFIMNKCQMIQYQGTPIKKILIISFIIIGIILIILSKPKIILLLPIILIFSILLIFFILPFLKRPIEYKIRCNEAYNCDCNNNECDCNLDIDDNTTCKIKCPIYDN